MSTRERFLRKVRKYGNGCWLWQGWRLPSGYGMFHRSHGSRLAHRVAYEIFTGKIPQGMLVCHKCDVTSCVNPGHLFLGTDSENKLDSVSKGRWVRGVGHRNAKLSKCKVIKIFELKSQGVSGTKIAKQLGVSFSLVYRILRRERHVLGGVSLLT